MNIKILLVAALVASSLHAENWPCWRGPRLDGTSLETKVPTQWDTNQNILWKTALPGMGHASPIVYGDRLFTVTALPEANERCLLCLDRRDGKILWQTVALTSSLEVMHKLNSPASSTPATDGQRVFTAFLDGKEMVVAAYDFNGKQQWLVRPGAFSSKHGFCSSPIVYQDKVIVNGDHDGDGYMVALDRQSGKQLWKIDRPNKTRSYVVPAIYDIGGRTQMVLSGTKCVTSYNPQDGSLFWIIDGPTEQFVASMVYGKKADLMFITGGFPDHHILAIDPHGNGNVTQTHIRWRTNKGVAYVPSPIVEGDYFLVVSDGGVAHCFEAATGELLWQERTGEQHASLVSANGLVYFLNDLGITRVIKPGRECQILATNDLGEKCFASPAISDGQMFIRGFKNLYCIGTAGKK
ncbi:MAG: PQQ-binding-like beta-propeller repeat protein [Verrucomicrobiota bacterium]